MNRRCLYALVLVAIVGYVSCTDGPSRTNEVVVNPDCKPNDKCNNATESGSFYNLVYIKATGPNDIVHYMYSSIGAFSILVFRTKLNVNVSVDWDKLLSQNDSVMYNAITFTDAPLEMSGYVLPSLYEFNDTNGDADITKVPQNSSFIKTYKTSDMIWNKFNSTLSTASIGVFEGKIEGLSGSLKIAVRFPGKEERDHDLPHLLVNSDSSSADLIFDSFVPEFNTTAKFAVNVAILTTYQINVSYKRTLDDEYTPGTFKLWNAELTDKVNNTVHSFFQWKPVFYYSEPRTLENSTITRQYDLKSDQEFPTGLGSVFYNASYPVSSINISFGLQGKGSDGYFYTKTSYSVWSFSTGVGAPPVEKMSFIVTLVIFIGFGLPALVIVIGLFVAVVRKLKNSRSSEFNEI